MAAYVIADITILDPDVYEGYRRQVPAVIEKYGGRYLVRGGASEAFEGDWQPSRLIVLEFPDMDALQRWYQSDDYQALLRIRQSAARSNIIAVQGV
jgi:uncharacterized protein (DUF1330 family)